MDPRLSGKRQKEESACTLSAYRRAKHRSKRCKHPNSISGDRRRAGLMERKGLPAYVDLRTRSLPAPRRREDDRKEPNGNDRPGLHGTELYVCCMCYRAHVSNSSKKR
jgi:hypothetical protein